MIRRFNSPKRLFFPIRWANSVSDWILGLKSPSGTLKIRNTANPDESGGCSIDVDVNVVSRKIRELLFNTFVSVSRFFTYLAKHIDDYSIVGDGRRIKVSDKWVEQKIDDALNESDGTPSGLPSGVDNASQSWSPSTGTSWTRGSGDGVKLYVLCRAWVYDQQDGVISFRKLTFDRRGLLVSVGSESQTHSTNFVIQS